MLQNSVTTTVLYLAAGHHHRTNHNTPAHPGDIDVLPIWPRTDFHLLEFFFIMLNWRMLTLC